MKLNDPRITLLCTRTSKNGLKGGLGLDFHPWKLKPRRHSKVLVRVKSHSCFKRLTFWWVMRSEREVGLGSGDFCLLPPYPWILNQSRLVIHGVFHPPLMPSPAGGDIYAQQKDMKALLQKAWCKEISTVPEGRLNVWAQAENETGQRFETSLVKVSWCKSEPLKIVWEGPKNHLTGLINRQVRCWNYFKTDAFLNCIQNTFRGSLLHSSSSRRHFIFTTSGTVRKVARQTSTDTGTST